MNRPETPNHADPDDALTRCPAESTDLLEQYLGGAADDVLFWADVASDVSDDTQCEETCEQETHKTDAKPAMAAQVGAYFAAEITHAPDEVLRAAGRLGPKRVLALLA